jgi:FkbM family methyltransferase
MIKQALKYFLNLTGYEVVNKQLFGNDILRDLKSIAGQSKRLTIFDIGANIGQTAIEFKDQFQNSDIYSFEPDSEAHSKLTEQTKNYKNIKTFNLGFGNTTDKLELNINKASGGNSLLPLSEKINQFVTGDWTEKIGLREVDITTLNAFCSDNKIKSIDILKIDTQGYELKIIEGGDKVITPDFTRMVYIEVLFVELYKQQAYFNDIYATLTQRGYKLAGFYNEFYSEKLPHYLLWCDALFVKAEA